MLELVQRILSETYVNILCSQHFDVPRKRLMFALIISLLYVAKNSLQTQLIKLSTNLWSLAGENNSIILFGLLGDFLFIATNLSCLWGHSGILWEATQSWTGHGAHGAASRL